MGSPGNAPPQPDSAPLSTTLGVRSLSPLSPMLQSLPLAPFPLVCSWEVRWACHKPVGRGDLSAAPHMPGALSKEVVWQGWLLTKPCWLFLLTPLSSWCRQSHCLVIWSRIVPALGVRPTGLPSPGPALSALFALLPSRESRRAARRAPRRLQPVPDVSCDFPQALPTQTQPTN